MQGFITWVPNDGQQRVVDVLTGEVTYTVRAYIPIYIEPAHRAAVITKLQASGTVVSG